MNGKIILTGEGLKKFKLVNGERHWLDMPSKEWYKHHLNPSYPNKNETKKN